MTTAREERIQAKMASIVVGKEDREIFREAMNRLSAQEKATHVTKEDTAYIISKFEPVYSYIDDKHQAENNLNPLLLSFTLGALVYICLR
jgi:hypothetical protein